MNGGMLILTTDVTAVGYTDTLAPVPVQHTAEITDGTLSLNVAVANGTRKFTVNPNNAGLAVPDLLISANIANGLLAGAKLEKDGTGYMTISGASTHTGLTTVTAGALEAQNAAALGTTAGTVVADGASLVVDNVTITGEALTINGQGFAGLPGTPARPLAALTGLGTSAYSNDIVANAASVGSVGGTLTLDKVISGSGGLTVNAFGAGTVLMSGNAANTYTGLTTVNAGQTLDLNKVATGPAPPAGTPLVAVPGDLTINGVVRVRRGIFTGASAGFEIGTGSSNVVIAGDGLANGILRLDDGGPVQQTIANLTFTGGLVDLDSNAGNALRVTGNVTTNASASTAVVDGLLGSAGQFQLAGTDPQMFSVADGAAAVDLDMDVGISSPLGVVGLTKTGTGTMQYTGLAANTYTGNTQVNEGGLLLNKADGGANGTAFLAGTNVTVGDGVGASSSAVLRNTFTSDFQLGGTANAVSLVVNSDGLYDLNGEIDSIRGASPALTINGGIVALAAGELNIIGPTGAGGVDVQIGVGSGVITGSGAVGLDLNGAQRVFDAVSGGSLTVTSNIASGSVKLDDASVGRVTFTANNTYAGTTTVDGGVQIINGNQPTTAATVTAGGRLGGIGTVGSLTSTGGTVSPGGVPGPGVLSTIGVVTLDSASTYSATLNGTIPGLSYSQLNAGGAVTLAGTLSVNANGVFTAGTTFDIIRGASISGTFTGLPNGTTFTTSDGKRYTISYTSTDVLLTVVAPTTTTSVMVSSGVNPSVFQQPVTFTATVNFPPGSPAPTGNVVFSFDGSPQSPIAITNYNASTGVGIVSITVPNLTVGSHTVIATFANDPVYAPSVGTLAPNQAVNKANTSTSVSGVPTSIFFGQQLTATATVGVTGLGSGTPIAPAGNVTYTDSLGSLPTVALSGNSAILNTSSLGVGSHVINATYNGDGNFNGSSSTTPYTVMVNAATTTTTLGAPSQTSFGQPVVFTAQVTVTQGAGTPDGSVVFKDNGVIISPNVPVVGGVASFSTSSLSMASHSITVEYASSSGNFASSVSAPSVVKVGTNNQFSVNALYVKLLGRQADLQGLNNFAGQVDAGVSLSFVARQITNSLEFRQIAIDKMFQTFLDRTADTGGLTNFTNMMNAGLTFEAIEQLIVGSQEYFNVSGGTNAGFVANLFQDALGRAPEAGNDLVSRLGAGMSPTDVANIVFSSLEYRRNILSAAANVPLKGLYLGLLGRAADEPGIQAFVSLINAGARAEDVIAFICGSQEFINKAQP